MIALIIILALLLAFGVLGAVVEGLLWLTLIALVLAFVAGAIGWRKLRRIGEP